MKLSSCLAGVSFVSLVAAAGCGAGSSEPTDEEEAVAEEAITGAPSNSGYFLVTRRDSRKCMSPLCGGFFVKRVNEAKTRCADGSQQAECYVSSIELGGMGLSAREEADFHSALASGKALVKARTYKRKVGSATLGVLKANEGWLGATGSAPEGTFYRAADNGIRCIKAPCPTTTAYALNGKDQHHVIDVRLDQLSTPAAQDALDRAALALGTKEGILVAGGLLTPKCVPGSNCGPLLVASELYLRVARREGELCGSWRMSGCNAGQYCRYEPADVCGAADAPGRCAFMPDACAQVYAPVCGCDGNSYGNACEAASAGTSVATQGACAPTP